jgi:hypothetical protein
MVIDLVFFVSFPKLNDFMVCTDKGFPCAIDI